MYCCPNCDDEIIVEDPEHLGFCSLSCKQEHEQKED